MRDLEVGLDDLLVTESQDVEIDHPGSPAKLVRLPPKTLLDRFAQLEERPRLDIDVGKQDEVDE
jgi:hypothetical protein